MMDENPYEAPLSPPLVTVRRIDSVEFVLAVAKLQKWNGLLLACQAICMIGSYIFLEEAIAAALGVSNLICMLASAVVIFALSYKIYSLTVALLYGFLAVIPCVGLVVLVQFNSIAVAILKENGFRVGFFGASLAEIRRSET